ncbi:hypothetical protein ALC57_11686 [Trachymyrmex cornetzi]|uniref:MADF domain-containing protein n=1 Tax=Trachymyrmex cornetzi TaxID=471704 RepID=A0A151J2B5_9HYME|nr:hypothetical protein ALC57_11686 [Trachymyrmex cornetzi]
MKMKNSLLNATGLQCATKISGLKRIYKNIKDQNKKSGNCRNSWTFLTVMDSIFREKKYITPPAIASSESPSSSLLLYPLNNSERDRENEKENEIQFSSTKREIDQSNATVNHKYILHI